MIIQSILDCHFPCFFQSRLSKFFGFKTRMLKEFEEDRVNFVRVVDHLHALGS